MIKILKFQADWCNPCKTLSPIMKELALEFDLEIKEINIDEEDDLVEQYEIRSIPTLIFFKNNIQVLKTTGSKSKEQLKVLINKIKNGND